MYSLNICNLSTKFNKRMLSGWFSAALKPALKTADSSKRNKKLELECRVKRACEWFKQRMHEYDTECAGNDGKLAMHDCWRYAYYKSPYLILETDEAIIERFTDIFTNSFDISSDGKLTPAPLKDNNNRLARLFTEIIEETNWRGALHKDSMSDAKRHLGAYFENGPP